jgi:DNA-binding transcriptional LysR family regulator
MASPPSAQLNLDDLQFLLAITRSGRMVTAGLLLGVDHTTVRRRIDRLEKALGARLLDRGADGWELTAIGREVVESAQSLDSVVERVRMAASGDSDSLHGSVRVVTPEGFGIAFATPALARLHREHPNVSIELVTSSRPLAARGVGFDLAVTIGKPAGPRLFSEPLSHYALRLYASPEYLAGREPIKSIDDLAGHDLVFYVDGLLTLPDLDLAPLLGGMRAGLSATSVPMQVEATRHGAGIGLLHAFLAAEDPQLVPVLPGVVEFRPQFSLTMRRESRGLAAVGAARQALIDEVQSRSGELLPTE